MAKAYPYLFGIAAAIAGIGTYYFHGQTLYLSIVEAAAIVVLVLGLLDRLNQTDLAAIGKYDPKIETDIKKLQTDLDNNVATLSDILKLLQLVEQNLPALMAMAQNSPSLSNMLNEIGKLLEGLSTQVSG